MIATTAGAIIIVIVIVAADAFLAFSLGWRLDCELVCAWHRRWQER